MYVKIVYYCGLFIFIFIAAVLKYLSEELSSKEGLSVTQLCNIYNMHTYSNSDLNQPIYHPSGNCEDLSLPSILTELHPLLDTRG